jgi:outer membrane protein TolC
LQEAIQRGLKFNLGLYLSGQGTQQARGARLRALSALLPNLTATVGESSRQVNLAAFGFPPTPGVASVRGPFSVFDARAAAVESLSFASWNNYRASLENLNTSQLNYQNARDLVVLVSGGLYMQALAGAARIEAVQAQLTTARTLFNQAVDLKKAGVTPGIDVLRAQVEYQVQQQRLVAAKNDFDKQKLQLARAIGLPVGQQIELAEVSMPYSPAPPLAFEQALQRALANRADYKAAKSQVRAAELTRKAAIGEALPSIQFTADYGTIGQTPGNSHGTYTAAGALVIPIFQGGRVKGDVQQADALLAQRKAEADDSRNRIEFEVRSAFLDLNSAAQQVEVARSSVGLAQEQVRQAQDRFAAGVTNNIEVIQAQEALATTNDNYINSLLAHNLAKLSLARALGVAEEATKEFLGGTQ